MKDQTVWSVIHKAWGTGNYAKLRKLIESVSAAELWESPDKLIKKHNLQVPPTFLEQMKQLKQSVDLARIEEKLESNHIHMVLYGETEYPEKLKNVYNPPTILYVRGSLPPTEGLAIAMVGSRKCTEYGKRVAYQLATELGANGCTVISGLARGIDAASHQGTLKSGGITIGVLGCGVDVIYPRENKNLYQEMLAGQNCGIISELPLGSGPLKHHFPMRNRIISGLSDGIIVVEAAVKSGALITAELALEQGKDVFAVPGAISSPQSAGCHKLIKDGAKLVAQVEDILEEYGQLCLFHEEKVQANDDIPLDDKEKKILHYIGVEPISIEEIAVVTKLPINEVMATLSWLEINDLVQQIVGRKYIRLG